MAQLFRENGISYDKVNYYNEPMTAEKLRSLLKKAGMKAFDILRKGEAAFKESNINENTPNDEIIDLIVANPNMLQRPIVEVGGKAVVARPAERALELIRSASA